MIRVAQHSLTLAYTFPHPLAPVAGHFQSAHHPCPHPSCLERKFVVFAEEQDLRRHFATEHGNEANMSRAQRRQVWLLCDGVKE